jgi:flavodoxin
LTTLAQRIYDGAVVLRTGALENFATAATRQAFVLAATYGDGQAPADAIHALAHIAKPSPDAVPVPIMGQAFRDRQFGAFCAFGEALEQTLRTQGRPTLLPLERIHQQSSQQFARWCEALPHALGELLVLDHQAFSAPQQKQRIQPHPLRQGQAFAGAGHQQGGGPGVGVHATAGQHGDRCQGHARQSTGAWVCAGRCGV